MGLAVDRRQGHSGRSGDQHISTDFDKVKAAVANVIPPQRAGRIAEIAGAADRSGWCPIDPVSFESQQVPNIHVIGDAAIAGAMPKSAFAANAQAKVCAVAVAKLSRGEQAGRAEADQHLLQPGGAGLRRSRSPASIIRSMAQLAEVAGSGGTQSARRSATLRVKGSRVRRWLVPHHHLRGVRLMRWPGSAGMPRGGGGRQRSRWRRR